MIRTIVAGRGRTALFIAGGMLAALSACKSTNDVGGASGTPTLKAPSDSTGLTASGTCGYTLDFGQVAIGSTTTLDLQLSDTGSSPLNILNVSAPSDAEFSMVLPQQTIQQGQSTDVSVSFKPFSEGSKTGTVTFTTDSAACETVTVTLTGNGVFLKLVADPTTVDFGQVVVHSSPVQIVTLTNSSALSIGVTPGAIGGANASLFSVDQTMPFSVAPNSSMQMHVTYSPLAPSLGDNATLTLTLSEGGTIQITMKGVALQSGLKIVPNPMDFSFVQPGDSLSLPLTLTNVGNENITVSSTSIVNPGTPAAFSLSGTSWSGGTLAPGDVKTVNVIFAPTTKDKYTGELDVASTDSNNIVPVALTGFGGGAIITCTPLALQFGTVAAGIGATLPVICTNTGSDVPNHPEAGLSISSLPTDKDVFSAQVDSASPAQPLAAGQALQVDVSYLPTATETDTGTLKIISNTIAPVVVALSGNAIAELPCSYSLVPANVNFGEVKPGTSIPGGFVITNNGPNECLLTGLNLGAGTQNVFALTSGSVTSQRLSAPNTTPPGAYPTSWPVNVTFTPTQTGSYTGTVQFTISDPSAPHQTVDLSGVGGASCFLINPVELDYGTVGISNGQFCANGKRKFVGVNGCAQSVTITGVTMEAGGGVYSFITEQVPQTVQQGGTSTPFEVGFKPLGAGTFTGTVLVQTDLQTTPFGVGLSGSAVNGNKQTDKFIGHTPQVDVLWVMDTDDDPYERNTIATKAPDFVNALNMVSLDYQIAVTSSDYCANGPTGTAENGRILPCPGCKISGQTPTIITPADGNGGNDLQTLMEIGANTNDYVDNACYPDEQFFNVAYQAVVGTTDQNWNAGFVRPDAYLAIITMNGDNEDDNSRTETPQWFANQFLSVKGADHPELFSWSYINPSQLGSSGGHQPFNRLPQRLASLLSLAGGVALDTQQNDWEQGVLDLWNIVLASSTRFPLSGSPDPTSILVYLDGPPPGQTMPGQAPGVLVSPTNPNGSTNWSYDATSNTLDINNSSFSLTSSDVLYVQYTLVCD